MQTRSTLLFIGLLVLLAPVCSAQENTTPDTGSGTDVWTERTSRAEGFRIQMNAFALQRSATWNKWQLSRNKLTDHLDRCHTQIRASNRDTLLPVTQQCLKGQLIIERDALKRDRAILEKMPGLTEPVRTALLQKIDALTDAIQTIIDGVDAHVFTTMTQLKDVRANLLTQYRQPYWLAMTQARADEAMTWIAHLLTSLKDLTDNASLVPAATENITQAMTCLENAESLLFPALSSASPDDARAILASGITAVRPCNALILEAQEAQSIVQE